MNIRSVWATEAHWCHSILRAKILTVSRKNTLLWVGVLKIESCLPAPVNYFPWALVKKNRNCPPSKLFLFPSLDHDHGQIRNVFHRGSAYVITWEFTQRRSHISVVLVKKVFYIKEISITMGKVMIRRHLVKNACWTRKGFGCTKSYPFLSLYY